MKENTIVALLVVKDELFRVSDILNFNITKELIDEVKSSHFKYVQYLDEERKQKEQEEKRRKLLENEIIKKGSQLQIRST